MKAQKTDSQFWKPEVGELISGKFQGFFQNKYGITMQIGDKNVSLNYAMLKSLLRDNLDLFKKGVNVTVKCTGEGKKKGSRSPVKYFEILVGKKVLSGNVVKELSNKEVQKELDIPF